MESANESFGCTPRHVRERQSTTVSRGQALAISRLAFSIPREFPSGNARVDEKTKVVHECFRGAVEFRSQMKIWTEGVYSCRKCTVQETARRTIDRRFFKAIGRVEVVPRRWGNAAAMTRYGVVGLECERFCCFDATRVCKFILTSLLNSCKV